MFAFFKKRLFRRMSGYVDNIRFASYARLRPSLENKYNHEKAGHLAAAVVNKLFACAVSPMHEYLPTTLVNELSTEFLRDEKDKELIYGIIMSLRTLATIVSADHDEEALHRILDTIQWVGTIISLPPDAPDPNMMEKLAVLLYSRYC